MVDTRAIIQSDPYFNGGWGTAGRIALLDTGMRFTHTLNSNNVGAYQADCVNTNDGICVSQAAGWNPSDSTCGHGTQAGLIMHGNSNLGANTRGITSILVDSFKNSASALCLTDVVATVRSFQSAVAFSGKVILDEDDDTGNEVSAISAAADAAFDSGAIVIVPAGNRGPSANTTGSPGNAHKVISIGALDPATFALKSYSARGPQSDSRVKPELLAPTDAVTGSRTSDTSTAMFTGTSAAAPHGAAAGALLLNAASGNSGNMAPGLVYALMLASGDSAGFSDGPGAGVIRLPVNADCRWASVAIANGQTQLFLPNMSPTVAMDVALWWPESPSVHQDLDLELYRPGAATPAAVSNGVSSVFEKVRTTTSLSSGTWQIKVHGYSVTGTQTAYLAFCARF